MKKFYHHLFLIFLITMLSFTSLFGQITDSIRKKVDEKVRLLVEPDLFVITKDSLMKLIKNEPSFGIYRNNYFMTGVPLNKPIADTTTDAKFQISIRQRLMKTSLPLNTFLYLTYTQKSFWNIYLHSKPFADNNYNPALNTATPIFINNRFVGMIRVGLEHESNGRDGDESRSWNFLSLSANYFFNMRFSIMAKYWVAQEDKKYNPGLIRSRGIGFFVFSYRNFNGKYRLSLKVNPSIPLTNINTTINFSYKPWKKYTFHLFMQLYNGYAEQLLNYKEYKSQLRVGIALKPKFVNYY